LLKGVDIFYGFDRIFEMSGYTKLFNSIIDSTVWRESKDVKIVWITMLAKCDKNGLVEASLPGLADAAKVTMDECKAALMVLMSPDPYSRTKEHEGRRIAECDGGWQVLNHGKYRDKLNKDERRDYQRAWMANKRAEDNVHTESQTVAQVRDLSRSVTAGHRTSGAGRGDFPGDVRDKVEAIIPDWRKHNFSLLYKQNGDKFERVLAETILALKEGRVQKTPGAFFNDTWKRFV
jgi:hypothetical protein